jgi:exodeoxyribonuclease VII small subunit
MKEEIEKLPYEKVYAQLEKIVNELEKGEVGLDRALAHFEKGITLYRECGSRLKTAEAMLQKIVGETDEGVQLDRFNFEDRAPEKANRDHDDDDDGDDDGDDDDDDEE